MQTWWMGWNPACLRRARGGSGQEGKVLGWGGGSPPLKARWGCLQIRDLPVAPARSPASLRGLGLPYSGFVKCRMLGNEHSSFRFQYRWVAHGTLVLSGACPPPPRL